MTVRMLLSHNYTLAENSLADRVPALSRAEFAAVFAGTVLADAGVTAQPIDHPHWSVALAFDDQQHAPDAVGGLCVKALQAFRQGATSGMGDPSSDPSGDRTYVTMALGGLKLTPVTGSHPLALQTGEWGVDVVETVSPEDFLNLIGWERTVSTRAPETYFNQSVSVGV